MTMAPTKKKAKQVVIDCTQGSPEWLSLRCGRVTASRICDVMAFGKTGQELKARRDYRIELVTEILTDIPCETLFETPDMKRGTELEPFARLAYEAKRGVKVSQTGFYVHPEIERAGASPDGLIGEDGLIEIKCPRYYNHINNILSGGVSNPDYQLQMLWQMECTGRSWCDFVSYEPTMPDHLKIFIVRFNRDEEALKRIREEVKKFIVEVEALVFELANIQ